jgi:predicted enzyme related to lactoylglutathione lyase
MSDPPRLLGVELYFDDLSKAKRFYQETLGLLLTDEESGHHAQFDGLSAFICLERKGAESYPSQDKAVIFLEVTDLQSTIDSLGADRFVGYGSRDATGRIPWAAMHDPEGHNILLVEAKRSQSS